MSDAWSRGRNHIKSHGSWVCIQFKWKDRSKQSQEFTVGCVISSAASEAKGGTSSGESMWLVLTPKGHDTRGPYGFCPNSHLNCLRTAFVRNVQITPKVSDQSKLLGGFNLNPKWLGIINKCCPGQESILAVILEVRLGATNTAGGRNLHALTWLTWLPRGPLGRWGERGITCLPGTAIWTLPASPPSILRTTLDTTDQLASWF